MARPSQRMQWVSRAGPSRIWVRRSPSPSSISRFSSGISSPSNSSSQAPPSSSGPMVGTRRSDAPAGLVLVKEKGREAAARIVRGARDQDEVRWRHRRPEMNHFRPCTMYFPPRFSARVSIMPPGSEPEPGCGSVITKEERTLPSMMGCSQWSFSASVFSTLLRTFMLPSSGAAQLKASGPKIERLASS